MGKATYPALIVLIRHGEKPDRPDDPHLGPAGRRRAQMLATVMPERYPALTALFATAPSPNSVRPIETIQPLADVLGVSMNRDFADGEHRALATKLLDGALAGQTVLVCWHHEKLPALARELGIEPEPGPWPDDVYDAIWAVDFSDEEPVLTASEQPAVPAA